MAQPHRYPLIYNAKARSQRGKGILKFIADNENYLTLYATESIEEAKKISTELVAQGAPAILAAGGDGTLNSIASCIIGSSTTMGIIPSGTMNVFARELKIPPGNLQRSFEIIQAGHTADVDIFSINQSPFLQMAGIGFDAKVVENTSWESKKKYGPLAYLLASRKALTEHPPLLEITFDNGIKTNGVAVIAGNGKYYGGQFPMFRHAKNHDELLDVLVFQENGFSSVIDAFCGLVAGGVDLAKSIHHFQTKSFSVKSHENFPMQIDGELLGNARDAQFHHSPSKLKVFVPR